MRCTLPLALTFLTVLPWPWPGRAEPRDLARSLFWFPWVGALLGLAYWGLFLGLVQILPSPAAAALLLAVTVWATGGLHLDGLADTADGLGGSRPEDRLRIMKDSRLGAFGAVTLGLALILKFAFFLSWADKGLGMSFSLYPVFSRWGMVLLAFLSPYARPEGGLGQAMTQEVDGRVLVGGTASGLALALALAGPAGVLLLGVTGGLVWLLSLYFRQKLGGVTGDVLGANNEILEIMLLGELLLCQLYL
jgi:adenosylcobinamide-GDP ribazoletransferase